MIIFSLFFQNEKVADTKSRLQQLMINTPQTQDKSLLIQTVALFEALLGKIHQLQEENDTLKTTLESNKEVEELSKERDQIIFELEATRNKLEDSNKVLLLFQIRSLCVCATSLSWLNSNISSWIALTSNLFLGDYEIQFNYQIAHSSTLCSKIKWVHSNWTSKHT